MDITFFIFLKAHYLDYPHLETEIPPLEVVNPRLGINFPQMFKLKLKPISFFGNVNSRVARTMKIAFCWAHKLEKV